MANRLCPSIIHQADIVAFTSLINVIKYQFIDTPEIYKTVLAFLTDFDPNLPGIRERTMKYICLLIKDEALVKCISMSLPDASESVTKKSISMSPQTQLTEEQKQKKMKISYGKHMTKQVRTPPKVETKAIKTVCAPLYSKSEENQQDLGLETTAAAATTVDETKTSPHLSRSSHTLTDTVTPAPVKNSQAGAIPKDRRHSLAGTRPHLPHMMFPFVRPHTQAMGVFRPEITMTTEGTQPMFAPTPTLAFPFPYGAYRYPIPFQPNIPPPTTLAWNPSLSWQQMQYMSGDPSKTFWPQCYNMTGKPEGLDLSVPPKAATVPNTETSSLPGENLGTITQNFGQIKRRIVSVSSLESDGHSPPKMAKINSESLPSQGPQAPETFVTTEMRHPLAALTDMVTNIDNTAQSNQNSNVKVFSKNLKTFPYTQEMEIQMSGEKMSEFTSQNNKTSSQTNLKSSVSIEQTKSSTSLMPGVSKPKVIQKSRSQSLSDLIKTPGSTHTDVGGLGAYITETTRTSNSTTLKIKLNTSGNGKLLEELLKMQQNRNQSGNQSSTLTKETEKQSGVVPGEAHTNAGVLNQSIIPVSSALQSKSSSGVKSSPAISTIQIFNTSIPGQAFAIQTTPNFAANRISVTDKAFLQTIKQRLLLKTKPQRVHSDSALATMKISTPKSLSVSTEVQQSSLSEIEGSLQDSPFTSMAATPTSIQPQPSDSSSIPDSDDDVFIDEAIIMNTMM